MKRISEIIATFFYIGKVKYAPGTFGSLPAFFISYIIMYLAVEEEFTFDIDDFSFYEQQFISIFILEIAALFILFLLGTIATHIYIQDKSNKDPKEVVIDEVVGQMLTIILCFFSSMMLYFSPLIDVVTHKYFDIIFTFLLPFILFRIFDILKPWPINWVDTKIKGAVGVMLDDIVAAIFASTVHYIISLIILDYYQQYANLGVQ